jgi:hypothetical protein
VSVSLNGSSYLARVANTKPGLPVRRAAGDHRKRSPTDLEQQDRARRHLPSYAFIGSPGVVALGSNQLVWVESDSTLYDAAGVNGAYAYISVCYRPHGTTNALTTATVDDLAGTSRDGSGCGEVATDPASRPVRLSVGLGVVAAAQRKHTSSRAHATTPRLWPGRTSPWPPIDGVGIPGLKLSGPYAFSPMHRAPSWTPE